MLQLNRDVLEYALMTAYFLFIGLGPPFFLLWTWRRWGSRRRLAVHAALLPVIVFVLLGSIGGARALIEVLRSPPTRTSFSRMGLADYVAYTYWQWGAWSVLWAGFLSLAWVLAALLWERFLPASFRRVTTPTTRRVLTSAEEDYGDGVAADPAAEPDRRRADG